MNRNLLTMGAMATTLSAITYVLPKRFSFEQFFQNQIQTGDNAHTLKLEKSVITGSMYHLDCNIE